MPSVTIGLARFGVGAYRETMKTAFALAVLIVAGSARAQVYEIGDGGALAVRDGGGAVVWREAPLKPIAASLSNATALAAQTVAPVGGASSSMTNYSAMLSAAAARHALNPALLEAMVWQESRWHANAVSPKGARGLTQLMPATAQALGVDARDPAANLDGGARYLRMMLDHFGGDVEKALAAYNAGISRVERAGGIPNIRETQNYVAAIMARVSAQSARP